MKSEHPVLTPLLAQLSEGGGKVSRAKVREFVQEFNIGLDRGLSPGKHINSGCLCPVVCVARFRAFRIASCFLLPASCDSTTYVARIRSLRSDCHGHNEQASTKSFLEINEWFASNVPNEFSGWIFLYRLCSCSWHKLPRRRSKQGSYTRLCGRLSVPFGRPVLAISSPCRPVSDRWPAHASSQTR